MKQRLDKNEELKQGYKEIIKEQLSSGIIEEVKDGGEIGKVTCLPHKEVIKEEKSTTKIRVVFDASTKKRDAVSLNKILYKGPSLTPKLFTLIKFRIYPIAISADIVKAYLQIGVVEEHRDYLRFLWFSNINGKKLEVIKYRFTRVIFGATVLIFC